MRTTPAATVRAATSFTGFGKDQSDGAGSLGAGVPDADDPIEVEVTLSG
jgi:hypothetical protein